MRRFIKERTALTYLSCLGSLIILCSTARTQAGMITSGAGVLGGGGTVSGLAIIAMQPGNDNTTTASPNVVSFQTSFTAPAPVDIVFQVADTKPGGGIRPTTEYFFRDAVTNNTQAPWAGFRFQLGFQTGARFLGSNPGNNLDFDFPHADPPPTASLFSHHESLPPPQQFTALNWSGGSVSPGRSVDFTFSIDVPNQNQLRPGGATEFTLRQVPVDPPGVHHLPEPDSLTLCALGILSLVGYGWRRRRTAA